MADFFQSFTHVGFVHKSVSRTDSEFFRLDIIYIYVLQFDCTRQEMPVISLCLNGAIETIEGELETVTSATYKNGFRVLNMQPPGLGENIFR